MGTVSASSTRATAITAETCSRCNGGGTCASCAQRRKRAWRLVALAGLSYEEAAARMQLTPEQMRLLVSQERDRQDLARYRLNMIPTERVRAFLEREQKRDPRLTRAEVAHYLDMKQIDLDRQLGYEPGKSGRRQRSVRVEAASRLVIALGRAPRELDGC
jgi:serine/threonine protein kinase HipA of HipAB toxin-antitoxin module